MALSPFLKRVGLAKLLGLILGLVILWLMPKFFPGASASLTWGLVALYLTMGGMIGVVGFYNAIPLFGWPMPVWLRGGMIGAWLSLVAVLLAWDALSPMLAGFWGLPPALTSPWWMLVDGFIAGAVIDLIVTRVTGRIDWPAAGLMAN